MLLLQKQMLECFISLSSRAFLDEVSSSLDSEANSSLTEVVAVLHVLAVVKHSEFFQIKSMLLFFFNYHFLRLCEDTELFASPSFTLQRAIVKQP